jgi:Predicted Zn-dependent proteases and their inactivated homologs
MRWWAAVAWIEDLLAAGKEKADEVEVYQVSGTSVSADLKKTRISLCSSSIETGIGIRTIQDGRIGISSTNDPGQWRACLDAAIASSRLATKSEWHGLPGPADLPGTDLTFDPGLEIGPGIAERLVKEMLEGAAEHPRATVTSGGAGVTYGEVTIANSRGVRYTSRQTEISAALDAVCGQSTGFEFDAAGSAGAVDARRVGERAALLAERSKDGKKIATGTYDVVLSPMAFADLLSGILVPSLSGRNVLQGRSKLAGKIGETVAAPLVSLYDDPHRKDALGSSWFDAEGTPTHRLDFIKDGVLAGFAYDCRTAYRAGTASTGSAVRGGPGGSPAIGHHNFVVDGKRSDLYDAPGVYVHGVVGAHTANTLTGDFSVEMSNAFTIRDGDLAAPVRSAMLAGNFFDLLGSVTALGKESRAVGSYILPPVRIKNVRVVGT